MTAVLVGDVGGTHARFGVLDLGEGRFEAPPQTLLCSAYTGLGPLVAAYLQGRSDGSHPAEVSVAVAGPVIDGAVSMTNLPWDVSEAELRRVGFARAVVINDFEALALAAPLMTPADRVMIGAATPPAERRTVAVIGPGTGFGAAAHCVDARGSAVLVTEGGHISFAPSDDTEFDVCRLLARRFGRVSLERVLSGPGLVNLHLALCEINGAGVDYASPADLLAGSQAEEASARATVDRFCNILGSVAGDLALAYGAVGGVLLAGGLAPRLIEGLQTGGFRAAFERKGRLAGYLSRIPTAVITNPFFALLGAAESLRRGP